MTCDKALVAELVEALEVALGYVERVHGTLIGVVGPDTVVKPDLEKIKAALVHAKGEKRRND